MRVTLKVAAPPINRTSPPQSRSRERRQGSDRRDLGDVDKFPPQRGIFTKKSTSTNLPPPGRLFFSRRSPDFLFPPARITTQLAGEGGPSAAR